MIYQGPAVKKNYAVGDRQMAGILLCVFLVWPLAGFLCALFNYRSLIGRRIVLWFCIFIGATYYVNFQGNTDSVRYASELIEMSSLKTGEFLKAFGSLYSSETSVDIYQPLITFIVSRFTSDYHVLFSIFALVFGWFYLKCVNVLYDDYSKYRNINALIHLFFFIFILPVWQINGVRMWTAVWIFFFGAYQVILYRKYKFLFVTVSAVFVHFSFILPNLILIVYLLLGNRNTMYYGLIILSFIVNRYADGFLREYGGILGMESMDKRILMYTNEDKMEMYNAGTGQAWFMKWSVTGACYYLLLAMFLVRKKIKTCLSEKGLSNLYSFSLLLFGFANTFIKVPSMGRFFTLFLVSATFLLVKLYAQRPGKNINKITLIGLFPLLLYSAVSVRQGFDVMNYTVLLPMPLPFLLDGNTLLMFFFNR